MAKNEKKPQDTTTQAEPKTDTTAPAETKTETKTDTKPTAKKDKAGPELFRVSDLAAKHETKAPILAAVRRAQAWAPGKQVTEEQFLNAVEAIKTRPMGGGRVRS